MSAVAGSPKQNKQKKKKLMPLVEFVSFVNLHAEHFDKGMCIRLEHGKARDQDVFVEKLLSVK